MYCNCQPPQLAVTRKVSKPGSNLGKEFFSCPTSQCNHFQWIQADSMSLVNEQIRKGIVKSAAAINIQPQRKYDAALKLAIDDFEQNPLRVWFSVTGPITTNIANFFRKIDNSKKKMKQQAKMWCFDFDIYEIFVSTLKSSEFESIVVHELPRFLINGIKQYLLKAREDRLEDDPELNLEPELLGTLLPFQLDGIKFVVKHKGKALIGDEMGCGKTIQAIGVIQHYRQYWPVLMLIPPNLMKQWYEELLRFLGDSVRERDIVCVTKGTDSVHGEINLVSYTILDKLVEKNNISADRFGIVIADESHNLKSRDSKRTSNALPFLRIAKVSVCLTGTPATNRPIELYTQLNSLLPYVFNDYEAFAVRYCDAKPNKFGPGLDVRGSSNERELKVLLENMVMIRRLKADVVSNLPTKSRELRYVKYSQEYEKQLKDIQSRSAAIDRKLRDPNKEKSAIAALRNEQRLLLLENYQTTGLSKIKAIKKEIEKLIEEARMDEAQLRQRLAEQTGANVDNSSPVEKQSDLDKECIDITDNNTSSPYRDCNLIESSKIPIVSEGVDEIIDSEGIVDSEEELVISGHSKVRKTEQGKSQISPSTVSQLKSVGNSKRRKLMKSKVDIDEFIVDSEDDNECDIFIDNQFLPKKCDDNHKKTTPLKTSDEGNDSEDDFVVSRNGKNGDVNTWKKLLPGKRSKRKDQETSFTKRLSQKIIVFAHHHSVLDAIEESLEDLQVGFVRVNGGLAPTVRNALIHKFQNDDSVDVALLSITACGTGLNLTQANVALFAELYWSPGVVLQAEDRIHRLGQKSSTVRIMYILAKGTADDIIWEQIQKKHNVLGATVGIADNKGFGMTIDKKYLNVKDSNQGTVDSFFRNTDRAEDINDQSNNNIAEPMFDVAPNSTLPSAITSTAPKQQLINSKDIYNRPNIYAQNAGSVSKNNGEFHHKNEVVNLAAFGWDESALQTISRDDITLPSNAFVATPQQSNYQQKSPYDRPKLQEIHDQRTTSTSKMTSMSSGASGASLQHGEAITQYRPISSDVHSHISGDTHEIAVIPIQNRTLSPSKLAEIERKKLMAQHKRAEILQMQQRQNPSTVEYPNDIRPQPSTLHLPLPQPPSFNPYPPRVASLGQNPPVVKSSYTPQKLATEAISLATSAAQVSSNTISPCGTSTSADDHKFQFQTARGTSFSVSNNLTANQMNRIMDGNQNIYRSNSNPATTMPTSSTSSSNSVPSASIYTVSTKPSHKKSVD